MISIVSAAIALRRALTISPFLPSAQFITRNSPAGEMSKKKRPRRFSPPRASVLRNRDRGRADFSAARSTSHRPKPERRAAENVLTISPNPAEQVPQARVLVIPRKEVIQPQVLLR